MIRSTYRILSLFGLMCFTFLSCTTFNNMSTGRTLGKGKNEFIPSMASFYAKGELTPPVLPQLIYNRGITERWDGGFNFSFGMIGLQSRYQILGNQQSEWCAAMGVSYTYFGAGLGSGENENTLDVSLSNLAFPLHISWHPDERLALYFSPKYSILGGKASLTGNNSSERVTLIGLTPGVEIGRKIKYIFEINLIDPIRTNENFGDAFATISIGAKFKW
jgi:hypothetical protein